MIFKIILASAIFPSAIFFSAIAHADQAPVNSAVLHTQAARLTEVLRPYVVPLDRDMVTFHYESPDPQYIPKTQNDLELKFLKARSFFIPEIDDGNMQGPGIYVSVDPVGSRTYGGWTDPQLYVFTIKKNARLLNTTSTLTNKDKVTIRDVVKLLACESESYQNADDLNGLTAYFRDNKNKDCARAIIASFNQLKVQGILYSYGSSNSLKTCRNRGEAINIISPEVVDEKTLAYFSLSNSIYQKPLAGEVHSLYLEAEQDFSLKYGNSDIVEFMKVPAKLGEENVSPTAYKTWRDQYIYKCGQPWSPEIQNNKSKISSFGQNFTTVVRLSYSDEEIQNLLIDTRIAYSKKFNDPTTFHYFDIAHMNQIEDKMYLALGFPSDMSKIEQWRKGIDASNDYSISDEAIRGNKAEAILEEKAEIQSMSENEERIMNQLGSALNEPNHKHPELLWRLYQISGYGKKLSSISVNQSVMGFGGAPYLTAASLHDLGQKNAAIVKENRDLFIKILKDCAEVYKDPNSKPSDIDKGACGIRQSIISSYPTTNAN